MIILGIDPGFSFTGFGILEKKQHSIKLLEYGYLTLPSKEPLTVRVGIFFQHFSKLIVQHHVTDIALETSFLGKNAQNFLKLGYLRGILYLLADQHKLGLHEFAPREIKQAVTGHGGADKEQVCRIIMRLFPTMQLPKKLDVSDAIAICLTCLWLRGFGTSSQQLTHQSIG